MFSSCRYFSANVAEDDASLHNRVNKKTVATIIRYLIFNERSLFTNQCVSLVKLVSQADADELISAKPHFLALIPTKDHNSYQG